MSIDVFLSYASEDRDRVRPLVDALKARGWSVWWDREIVPGTDFEKRIDAALGQARCVVVAWSAHAVGSDWVHAEAHDGLARRVLVPLMLEPAKLPLAFRRQNAAQLFGWSGDAEHPEYQRLITGIERCLAGPVADTDDSDVPPSADVRRLPHILRTIAALMVIAVLLGAGAFWWWQRPVDRSVDVPPNSAAVLQFVNLGPPAEDYVSAGISHELLNLLTRVHELLVASSASSFAVHGDAAEIRHRLAVRYFVEGSYRQRGDGIVVEAQLVDTKTGYRLWSDSIDGTGNALVEVPMAIARRVVRSLNVPLSDESVLQLQAVPTTNPQALDRYLRGNDALRAPTETATLAAAESAFLEAVALDPGFAMPYGGLCRVHLVRYELSLDVAEFGAAESFCQRTLSMNALQADPYKALGELYLASGRLDDAQAQFQTAQHLSSRDAEAVIGLADVDVHRGDIVAAEAAYRRGVALEPNYFRTHAALAKFLFGQARFDEAASVYESLTQLDPSNRDAWNGFGAARSSQGDFAAALEAWQKALALGHDSMQYSNIGSAYFFLGRFTDAAQMYEQAVELEPKDHRLWGHLGDAREILGRGEEAKAAYERAADLARENLNVNPDDIETRVRLAGYDARLGREDLARRALAETLALTPDDPYLYYDAAVAYTRLRMSDEALDALAVAVKGGYPRHLVAADPQFESLRGIEQFSQLVR